jgi:hypothetical protein
MELWHVKLAVVITTILIVVIIADATIPVQLSGSNRSIFATLRNEPAILENNISSAMQTIAMQEPGIYNTRANVDASHIGVTLQRSNTGDDNAIANAVLQLILNYVIIVERSTYRGYLRIGLVNNNKQIVNIWEVSAADTLANNNGTINQNWINAKLNNYTGIRHYWAALYGDITRTVNTPGRRMSPAVGNWL